MDLDKKMKAILDKATKLKAKKDGTTEECAKVVPVSRIYMRDSKSYCAVLFDDNNRKPVARMYFNNPNRKYLIWFDEEWKEHKEPISEVHDIYQHQDRMRATVQSYLNECRTKKLREKKEQSTVHSAGQTGKEGNKE